MTNAMRTVGPLLAATLLLASGCDQGSGSGSFDWLRQPLEVAWLPGAPPLLAYTVAIDSPETHRTALLIAAAGDGVRFLQAGESDANGGPPPLPGTEISSADWLWSPQAHALGDRRFVFAIAEEADGQRGIRFVSWTGDVSTASLASGRVPQSTGAVAFAVVPCGAGDALCVLLGREKSGSSGFDVALARVDADGKAVEEPGTVSLWTTTGLIRSVHALPNPTGAQVDVLVQTCEGCDSLDYDGWETAIYGVTTRFFDLEVAASDGALIRAAAERLVWEGLADPATSTPAPTGDAVRLVYWRTADTVAPACHAKGHCPTSRALISALWTPDGGTPTESAAITRSEIAHLARGAYREGEPWVLWRERDAENRYLRELWLGRLRDGDPAVEDGQRVTRTFTPLLLAREHSSSPNALPFDYVDGLAVTPSDDGFWIALRYRDVYPGGAEVCGERALVGVWSARVSPDGFVLQESDDKDALARDDLCGGGGACQVGAGGAPTGGLLLVVLIAIGALVARLRPRRRLR